LTGEQGGAKFRIELRSDKCEGLRVTDCENKKVMTSADYDETIAYLKEAELSWKLGADIKRRSDGKTVLMTDDWGLYELSSRLINTNHR
jgi:hypothetical protein